MESPDSLSIRETITDLGNGDKPLLGSKLADLSNLGKDDMEFLEQVWAGIEPERRRKIVYRLVELAEDNFELSFDNIFWNCLKDQDAEVRCKAIEGLWEDEETSLINPLINLLHHDKTEKVQAAAANALGKFIMLAEHGKLRSCHTSKVYQALLVVVGDERKTIEVKRRALEAVSPLSLPEVRRTIQKAYQCRNVKLRSSAIYAMGKNCDVSWLPVLLKEMASADAEIRYEAAEACGELGEEEAVPYLIGLINDPDFEVQLAALRALGKIGGTDAKECLEQCLDNPNEAISSMAEQALEGLGMEDDSFFFPV